MGRYLLTADLHLTDKARDEYRWSIFPWLGKRAEGKNVDAIFILGDLTDSKDKHSSRLVNRIVRCLKKIARRTPIFIFMGNHDYKDRKAPFFEFLGDLDNIHYIKEWTLVSGKPTWGIIDDIILFLPHTPTPKKDWKDERLVMHMKVADFIFFHQALDGAVGANGFKIDGATPAWLRDVANPKAQIIGGDIHVPQEVGGCTYTGAPYPVAFGDDYQPRVLFWDGKKMRSLKRNTIKKTTIRLDGNNLGVVEDFEALGVSDGDQVKFVVTLPRSEYKDWHHYREIVESAGLAAGLVIRGIELRPEDETHAELPELAVMHTQPLEQADDFCEQQDVEDHYTNYALDTLDWVLEVAEGEPK